MELGPAAALGAAAGPPLAELSRVLATADSLWSRATWRARQRSRRGPWRIVVCTVVNAALFAAAAWRWQRGPALVVFALLFSVLLVISVIDAEHSRIPDRISFPTMAVGAVLVAGVSWNRGDGQRLLGVLVATVLFWGALGAAHLLTPAGLGRGDVKLGVILGMALGWLAPAPADAVVLVLGAFFLASVLGTALGVTLLIYRRRSAPYPFGPSLAGGAVLVMILSDRLVG